MKSFKSSVNNSRGRILAPVSGIKIGTISGNVQNLTLEIFLPLRIIGTGRTFLLPDGVLM